MAAGPALVRQAGGAGRVACRLGASVCLGCAGQLERACRSLVEGLVCVCATRLEYLCRHVKEDELE